MEVEVEPQAEVGQGLFDLGQRLAAEVLGLEQLVLALLDELVDLLDPGRAQAVVGPDRELQVLDRLGQDVDLAHVRDLVLGRDRLLLQRLVDDVQEDDQVVAHDLGRLGQGLDGATAPVVQISRVRFS